MISVGHLIESLHDDVSTSNLYGDDIEVSEGRLGGAAGLLCVLFNIFPAETDRTFRGGAMSFDVCN